MITTPAAAKPRRSLFKKQIPTLLGLGVLLVGLAVGAFLFSQGTGIFLPRATPETTPKSIRVSNVTHEGFSVTFITDEPTSGFIKYGTDPEKLTQVGDQRDQITGTVGEYTLHHISVLRGLEPNTKYYYVLGTGGGALFDDEGEPFTVTTARQAGTQPKALTVFGSASLPEGGAAEGSVVFVTAPNAGTLSSLVTSSGSWAVSLSNARTADGSQYAKTAEGDELQIMVMAVDPKNNTTVVDTVTSERAIDIQLGTNSVKKSSDTEKNESKETAIATPGPTASPTTQSATLSSTLGTYAATQSASSTNGTFAATRSGEQITATASAMTALAGSSSSTSSAAADIVDFTVASQSGSPTVTSTQPLIKAKAKPNVTVSIEVHSDTQITDELVANADGTFEIDIEKYSKDLEPGEHTLTFSYNDPTTGEVVTVTKTFIVAPKSNTAANTATSTTTTGNQLTANSTATPLPTATPRPSATPYGSGNPYPIPTAGTGTRSGSTSSGSATPRPATSGARGSTRSAQTATQGGLLQSGSVGTTMFIIGAGLFFMISGLWSWWVSSELAKEYRE